MWEEMNSMYEGYTGTGVKVKQLFNILKECLEEDKKEFISLNRLCLCATNKGVIKPDRAIAYLVNKKSFDSGKSVSHFTLREKIEKGTRKIVRNMLGRKNKDCDFLIITNVRRGRSKSEPMYGMDIGKYNEYLKKLSYCDLVERIFVEEEERELTKLELWEIAKEKGYISLLKASNPSKTNMGSAISNNIRGVCPRFEDVTKEGRKRKYRLIKRVCFL